MVEPARVAEVLAVCEKWQTGAAEIGVVTDSGQVRVLRGERGRRRHAGRGAGRRLPALRPRARPSPRAGSTATGRRSTPAPSAEETLLALLASPSVASKRWAFEQYDSVVGSRTVRRPRVAPTPRSSQIPEAGNAIAVSIDGNGRRVACDPYAGTIEAVLECAQNLACVGAEPLGLTNCLNFGNPEKPAPAWQLDRAVSGLADACEALGVPVVGGNVSLYNEGPEGPIYPTPVVGMVGELPDPARVAGSAFAGEGDAIALLGPFAPDPGRLGAGEAARRARAWACPSPTSPRSPPPARPSATRSATGRLSSAHDVSDGGLACALAESAIGGRDRLPASTCSRCASAAARPRRRCSARAPAASCVSGERAALEELGATLLGEVGGTTIEIAAGDRSLSRRPRRPPPSAWRSLADRLPSAPTP